MTVAAQDDITLQFRAAMRRLAGGVALVTTFHDGARHGMTATSVTSLSMDPPSLLACVNRSASMHDPLRRGGLYCVNLLRADQAELGLVFATKPEGEARFRAGDWTTDGDGLPALRDCLASMSCRVAATAEFGTHTVFMGNVREVRLSGAVDPLIYLDGQFGGFTAG